MFSFFPNLLLLPSPVHLLPFLHYLPPRLGDRTAGALYGPAYPIPEILLLFRGLGLIDQPESIGQGR